MRLNRQCLGDCLVCLFIFYLPLWSSRRQTVRRKARSQHQILIFGESAMGENDAVFCQG